MGRRVRGNVRSLLKRLPDSVREEMHAQLEETGKLALARAQERVPVDTGALKRGLSMRVYKSLRLRVGLIGKATNRKLYYGRIVEFGRKAKTVVVNRSGKGVRVSGNRWKRQALEAGVRGFYRLRVKPMAARPFVYNMTREQLYRPFQKIWGRAIHRAAKGAGND